MDRPRLAADFFLIAHDEFSGRLRLSTELLACGLGGAQLAELVVADRRRRGVRAAPGHRRPGGRQRRGRRLRRGEHPAADQHALGARLGRDLRRGAARAGRPPTRRRGRGPPRGGRPPAHAPASGPLPRHGSAGRRPPAAAPGAHAAHPAGVRPGRARCSPCWSGRSASSPCSIPSSTGPRPASSWAGSRRNLPADLRALVEGVRAAVGGGLAHDPALMAGRSSPQSSPGVAGAPALAGTSRVGLRSKKPSGRRLNPHVSTGITGQSSGRGKWVDAERVPQHDVLAVEAAVGAP